MTNYIDDNFLENQKRLRRRWAENIKWGRRDLGMTQVELAEAIGVGQQHVSRWELGTSAPADVLRPKIAALFDSTVEQVFPYDPVSA